MAKYFKLVDGSLVPDTNAFNRARATDDPTMSSVSNILIHTALGGAIGAEAVFADQFNCAEVVAPFEAGARPPMDPDELNAFTEAVDSAISEIVMHCIGAVA